jgi:RNA polymerase sigma-70 factor (ECF subfamily)
MLGSLVGDRVDGRLEDGSVHPTAPSAAIDVLADPVAAPDVDTYRDFVEAHLDEAYRLATFILRDRADAEDAVHDAAISAWRHWPERRDFDRSEAWFRRIVVNACRDRIRGRRRVRAVGMGLDVDPSLHPLVGDAAASFGDRDEIARVVGRLDLDDRVLVSLRYGLDLTVPAIAGALGMRVGTVKSRLHRSIAQLRAALQEGDR